MRSTGNGSRPPAKEVCRIEPADGNSPIPTEMEDLRVRVQQISLREQIKRCSPFCVAPACSAARCSRA